MRKKGITASQMSAIMDYMDALEEVLSIAWAGDTEEVLQFMDDVFLSLTGEFYDAERRKIK